MVGVPKISESDINAALAVSNHVVLILSVVGTHTFDGYGLLEGPVGSDASSNPLPPSYPPNPRVIPARLNVVRRGVIPFQQVSHIRDDDGLQGRPVSSAKDGSRLGISAGRALCRAIDKRAFKDDPVHYSDNRYAPNVLNDMWNVTGLKCGSHDLSFLDMSFSEYQAWFLTERTQKDTCPAISDIFVTK